MSNIKIGFVGGGIICNLGTTSDLQLFFDCIEFYVAPKYPTQDWSVLTDRFYRRYLRLDELDNAVTLMKQVEKEFKQLDNNAIDTDEIKSSKIKSDSDLTKNNLFDTFSKYFKSFYQCIEFVNYYDNKYGKDYKYQPIMVSITTIPYLMNYEQIPLSIFDELKPDEKPIWWTGKLPQ